MELITELREKFNKYLKSQEFTQSPKELYEPNNYFLNIGGKRMRPVLVLLGAHLYDKNYEDALPAAIAIEYFHNFSLIHDDIMDDAPIRRGQLTVHEKFDANTAILSGDALLVYAYKYLSQVPEKHFKKIFDTFNKTAIEVCEGQQLDMNFETQKNVKEEDYLNMICLKTSVVLAAGLKIGALIGNSTLDDAQLLYQYAINLGIAFQIQDDILDCYGEESLIGKQLGGDIIQNKKTILLIRALEASKQAQDNSLIRLLEDEEISKELKVEKVLSIYKKYHIKESIENLRNSYINIALEHLEKTSLPEDRKTILKYLVDYLVNRTY